MTTSQPVHIKRYKNRKMYDTEKSHYVELGDINATIRSGRSIKVEDKANGGDMTDLVLLSIIHQNETAVKSRPLSLGLMQRVIEAGSMATYAGQLERRLQ